MPSFWAALVLEAGLWLLYFVILVLCVDLMGWCFDSLFVVIVVNFWRFCVSWYVLCFSYGCCLGLFKGATLVGPKLVLCSWFDCFVVFVVGFCVFSS